MFSLDQNHGLKYLIERLDKQRLKFQYEKKNEIRDSLLNLLEVDNLIKHIKIHDPHLGYIMQYLEKDHFVNNSARVIVKLLNLMKQEDAEIERFSKTFSNKPLHEIMNEEHGEESDAEQLIAWATRLKAFVELAYKKTKEPHLKELIKRLSRIEKDMEWFEESLIEEHLSLIERAKIKVELL